MVSHKKGNPQNSNKDYLPFEYLISKIAASLPNAPKKPIFDLNIPTNH